MQLKLVYDYDKKCLCIFLQEQPPPRVTLPPIRFLQHHLTSEQSPQYIDPTTFLNNTTQYTFTPPQQNQPQRSDPINQQNQPAMNSQSPNALLNRLQYVPLASNQQSNRPKRKRRSPSSSTNGDGREAISKTRVNDKNIEPTICISERTGDLVIKQSANECENEGDDPIQGYDDDLIDYINQVLQIFNPSPTHIMI